MAFFVAHCLCRSNIFFLFDLIRFDLIELTGCILDFRVIWIREIGEIKVMLELYSVEFIVWRKRNKGKRRGSIYCVHQSQCWNSDTFGSTFCLGEWRIYEAKKKLWNYCCWIRTFLGRKNPRDHHVRTDVSLSFHLFIYLFNSSFFPLALMANLLISLNYRKTVMFSYTFNSNGNGTKQSTFHSVWQQLFHMVRFES